MLVMGLMRNEARVCTILKMYVYNYNFLNYNIHLVILRIIERCPGTEIKAKLGDGLRSTLS